jgi:hypothetical protein
MLLLRSVDDVRVLRGLNKTVHMLRSGNLKKDRY